MHKIFIYIILILPVFAKAQTEATLLYHWSDDNLPANSWLNLRYNETWGFDLNGREYGVIGTTDGMRIFDLTDPSNVPAPVAVLGGATGVNIIHRDMKTMNGYLYAVCDEESGSTLQIVDCHNLPGSAPVIYNSNEFVVTAHNLFIDTSQARLYLLGAQGSTKILDVSNPTSPKLLAKYPNASLNLPYVHDAYIHNHIGFMNCGGEGLWVVDFSDPKKPKVLGTMTNYPGAGYNHSGWMCDDGRYYILCDETHGSPVKVVDVSDYEDLHVVSSMNPASFTNQIPHNAIVRENLVYVSYYYDGLQVFDISDPLNPKRHAFYDSYLGSNEAGFAGAWGVNPNLPSGTTLLSDLNNGFYAYAPIAQPKDYQLRTNHPMVMACEGEEIELQFTAGKDFSSTTPLLVGMESLGNIIAGVPLAVSPGQKFPVKLFNVPLGESVIKCNVTDGQHTGQALVHIFVKPKAPKPALVEPLDGDIDQDLVVLLDWNNLAGFSSFNVEVSTQNGAAFEQNIIISLVTPSTSYLLSNLQEATTYYWRVAVENNCGKTYSDVFKFTTKGSSNILEIGGTAFSIFPNPVADVAFIQFEKALAKETQLALYELNGQLISSQLLHSGQTEALIEMKNLPQGTYMLCVQSGGLTKRTILLKS